MLKLSPFLLSLCIAGQVSAQADYPSKPVRLVVPFSAGGPTDAIGRIVGQELGTQLKQPFVVDNRPGATGMIGQDLVSKSTPDGYTLLMITSTSSNGYHLLKRTIDFARDFSMIGQVYNTTSLITINPNAAGMAGINNLKQLVAYAKANPGKLNYTSSGYGSMGHLVFEKVKLTFGLDVEHVNYKGQGPATLDVLAGRVPILSATFTTMPLVKAGKLRAIAVSTATRSPTAPDVPTFVEQGVPGLIGGGWVGMASAPGTPRAIVDKLAAALRAGLAKPDVAEKISRAVGTDPEFMPPKEFTAYATRDFEYWGKVIRDAGIKGEQ
jgi:tripartite-type tricarboxylate transporter receptor subunit TctC